MKKIGVNGRGKVYRKEKRMEEMKKVYKYLETKSKEEIMEVLCDFIENDIYIGGVELGFDDNKNVISISFTATQEEMF